MAAPYRACIRIRSSHVLLTADLVQKGKRLGGLWKNTKKIMKFSQRITQQVQIDIHLNQLQPRGKVLTTRAADETRLGPDLAAAPEQSGGGQPFKLWQWLGQPAVDTLGKARCLRNRFP